MKNRIVSILLILVFVSALMFVSCDFGFSINAGTTTNEPRTDIVSIKSIEAVCFENTESPEPVANYKAVPYQDGQMMMRKSMVLEKLNRDIVNPGRVFSTSASYILIYKSEHDIQLTVTLDNPKGEAIDAIEIACDDENATILVDGQYKEMNVTESGRIMNWAQEDPYQKTFYMKTTSEGDIYTVRINDIKVNGSWQGVGLENNELDIYKLDEDDLKLNFLANTLEYYEFEFVMSENISNLVVTGAENVEGNVYHVTENETVSWEYDYTYEGVTVHWHGEKEIELLTIRDVFFGRQEGFQAIFCRNVDPGMHYIYVPINVNGTDASEVKLTLVINDKEFNLNSVGNDNKFRYITSDLFPENTFTDLPVGDDQTFEIRYTNSENVLYQGIGVYLLECGE